MQEHPWEATIGVSPVAKRTSTSSDPVDQAAEEASSSLAVAEMVPGVMDMEDKNTPRFKGFLYPF